MGLNGYVGFNVCWNVKKEGEVVQDRALELDIRLIYAKGDNHTVMNNVAWDDNDDSPKCTICVPTELRGRGRIPMNANTVVVNNGAQKFQGLIC